MNIVVDTNVIAYYLLPGAHTDSAVALRERTGDWFVPKLWRSEFRNVLAGYVHRGSINLDGAKATIRGAEAEFSDFEREVDSVQVMDFRGAIDVFCLRLRVRGAGRLDGYRVSY